jgi:HK97 gp10 family phage protein
VSAAIEVKLEGLAQLQKRLDELPGKIQRRAIRKPLRATATKIARSVKAGTPRRTGLAAKHVKTTVRVSAKEAWARVGYKGGHQGTARIMRFYEFGTKRKGGGIRQPARPFFARAVGHWQTDAKQAFSDSLKAAVEREEDASGE